MANRNRALLSRSQIDREYAYQVEIEIPEGGLGQRLTAMHAWALEHARDYQTRSAGQYPHEAVRWCFRDAKAADAFRRRFGG